MPPQVTAAAFLPTTRPPLLASPAVYRAAFRTDLGAPVSRFQDSGVAYGTAP